MSSELWKAKQSTGEILEYHNLSGTGKIKTLKKDPIAIYNCKSDLE